MSVYYLFLGEKECAFLMHKTGEKMNKWMKREIKHWKTLDGFSVYFAQIPY